MSPPSPVKVNIVYMYGDAHLDGGRPYSAPTPTFGSILTTSLTSLKFSKVKYAEATEEEE